MMEYWGDSPSEATISYSVEWIKKWTFVSRLCNGDLAWFTHVYHKTVFKHDKLICLEIISVDDYLVRKLAGNLPTEETVSYRRGGTTMVGP